MTVIQILNSNVCNSLLRRIAFSYANVHYKTQNKIDYVGFYMIVFI